MMSLNTHPNQCEARTGRRLGPLDLRVVTHGGRCAHGVAYGFDEEELARLLTEASASHPGSPSLPAEPETLEAPALSFL
jgi:hypothetical protein